MSESEFIDEPRSWRGIILDAVRAHAATLYGLAAVFFGFVFLWGVVVLIHIEVTTIGFLARAEAEYGASLAETVVVPGVYLQLGINLTAFVACAHEVLTRVIGR